MLFTKPQMYESSAQLLLRDELVSAPAQEINRLEDRWGHIFDTAVEQIKSTKVLEGAKQYLALNEPQLAVGKVTIAPSVLPHTNILVVKGTGTNAEYTQHFVDATVDKFKELRDGIVIDTINGVSVALNERTEQLKALSKPASRRNCRPSSRKTTCHSGRKWGRPGRCNWPISRISNRNSSAKSSASRA